ncbi:2-oxoglutarate-dependent dioxygenase DAO-like [Rhododendron vialii]|uniref:2-oxoglutarate-dependent dioxygenase DAO-like n=1 Tax=Rhododendron vialii TaxID=182163 RepID=UPI00265D9F24|nr:2-oxoglutarate-dependent dioxygenase DAO-like [Rhododendron vialii]
MGSTSCTPVIDLQNIPSQSDELILACEQWGCFRIINHPIPATLMSEMKTVVRSLLDLPPEIKRRNTDVIAGSGYVAPTKINPLYEGLGLYDVGSTEAVLEFCSQLDASPPERDTILRYSQAVHDLAMELGSKIAESMGLGKDLFKGWTCQFRINKYSFTPASVGSSGVQIHTDSGFLTILQDDENVGGLEVMDKKSGEFVSVDPMPGALLVNLGDIATVWSNGRFYNVKHRVQCKEATTRLSIALFMLGPKEAAVEAPPKLVDTEHPRLYDPVVFEEYRKLRLSTGMRAGEALSLLSPSKH